MNDALKVIGAFARVSTRRRTLRVPAIEPTSLEATGGHARPRRAPGQGHRRPAARGVPCAPQVLGLGS